MSGTLLKSKDIVNQSLSTIVLTFFLRCCLSRFCILDKKKLMLSVSNSFLQFRDVLCVAKNLEFLHSTPLQTKSRRAQFNWWAKPVSTGTMFTAVTIKLNGRIKQLYACIPALPRTWRFATRKNRNYLWKYGINFSDNIRRWAGLDNLGLR